jgi:hypothetical protein
MAERMRRWIRSVTFISSVSFKQTFNWSLADNFRLARNPLRTNEQDSRDSRSSPFKSRNRPRQVPGTSDASKTQSGLIGS